MAQKYTRNMIRNVFIEMLDERPFDEITVTDLVTRCEINRKTFYYYYQDLYAVLTEIFESELEAVLGGVKEHVTWEEGIAQAVQIALQHKRAIYHVYHSMQRETLEKYLYNVAGEVMRRYVERQSAGIHASQGDKDIIAQFYQSALTEMVLNWIGQGMKEDGLEMITRMGQLVGALASQRLGVPFGIVDLSLAPTPAIGDSVARILEEVGLEVCGGCGTTAILAMLNDAVKKGGVMASSSVGGLSGAFIPVSEDEGMIAAAQAGALTLEKLEAMTAVCSVGIDMVAVPGDTTAEVISGLIADEIAIGVVNTKTTAVRVIPAIGKGVGDMVEFGGLLGSAPIMPIKTGSPAKFINRGGRIPAPIQSLKN